MPRMSKNGVDFFDVDDSEDSIASAKTKGYREYVPMTKNGQDVFDVEFSEDSYSAALAKGYKDADRFKFEGDAGKPNVVDSAIRGQVAGLAQEYDDEAGGALEAVGSKIGLRGLGSSNLLDIRRETPEEDAQSFDDVYRAGRDQRRTEKDAAHAANPGAYTAANVAAGVTSGLAVPGSVGLKGAAVLGGAQGLGRSEADLTDSTFENVGQAALDTVAGVGVGIVGYGVAKGIGKGVDVGGQVVGTGRELLKTAGRGAARGAREAGENMPGVVKPVAEAYGGLKGAVDELRGLKATADEIKGIAAEARDLLAKRGGVPHQDLQAIGNGKTADALSDDEAILAALLDEGENSVKRWVAQKAAVSHPGQVDADAYGALLATPTAERNAARAFDPREAATGLKGNIEGVQDLFKQARDTRFGQLQDAARNAFQPSHAAKVMEELENAIVDANRLNSVPGPVRNLLADVHGMIEEGTGTRLQGLTPGKWATSTPPEQFNRLQQARQLLDHQIKWANREGHGQGEGILRHLRSQIDDALKTSPDKVEADALYRSSKDVEGKFFGPTEFRSASGSVDVDEGKVARLLGNTDNAQRFKSAIEDLRTFASNPDLPPEFQSKAQGLVAELEKNIGTADTKRAIGSFRQSQGPSSPAIERLQSITGKNSLVKDAVQAPAGFLNQADQLVKIVEQKMGKPLAAMNPAERQQAVRYMVALKNQENPNQAAIDQFLKSP